MTTFEALNISETKTSCRTRGRNLKERGARHQLEADFILADFWGALWRVSPPVSSFLAHADQVGAPPAGFSPSCRSRSSATWGGSPSEGLNRRQNQRHFLFKKLVRRADVVKLTRHEADSWNMISQKSEQEEDLPPAEEQSHTLKRNNSVLSTLYGLGTHSEYLSQKGERRRQQSSRKVLLLISALSQRFWNLVSFSTEKLRGEGQRPDVSSHAEVSVEEDELLKQHVISGDFHQIYSSGFQQTEKDGHVSTSSHCAKVVKISRHGHRHLALVMSSF